MGILEGRRAVVTGGTTGIGFAAAELFVKEGATVVISGRDAQRVGAAATALGPEVRGIAADQGARADVERLAAEAVRHLGGVDVLVLKAGVTRPRPLDAIAETHVDEQLAINLKGPLFTLQAFAPHLAEGASVIATTSVLDRSGMPGMAVYSASKAALRSLVRTWAAELKDRGIRVNAVAPGPIETPIYGKLGLTAEQLDGFAGEIRASVPMRRFGRPDEVSGAFLFLAGPHGSYLTGEEIRVSGGWGAL